MALTIFPSVLFAHLEMLITSTAAKGVFFSWKTKKSHCTWAYLYMAVFSLPVKKKKIKTVTFVPVNGNVRRKPGHFQHL